MIFSKFLHALDLGNLFLQIISGRSLHQRTHTSSKNYQRDDSAEDEGIELVPMTSSSPDSSPSGAILPKTGKLTTG